MIVRFLTLALGCAALSASSLASTVTPLPTRPSVGMPYDFSVVIGADDTAEFSAHCGAWSWEDNALFNAANGEPPVGWTHTARWASIELTVDAKVTIAMTRQEGVPWPTPAEPERTAPVTSMFPSFTLWKGLETTVPQLHTYNNRGQIAWAPALVYVDHLDNSTATAVEQSFILPAGTYTIVFGSNAPATDPQRQGFKTTITTSPVAGAVAVTGGPVPGLEGVTFKRFYSPTVNDEEGVAFRAQLTGPGITTKTDIAILADIGETPLAIVAQKGAPEPNTGSTFKLLGEPVTDNDDSVVFLATVATGPSVTTSNDNGVFRYSASTGLTALIAREGDVAPGTASAKFKTFSSVAAANGGGAFHAKLSTASEVVNIGNDDGVWTFTAAGPVLVAREGSAFQVGPEDTRIVKTLQFLAPQVGVRGAGRSTNATGASVMLITFTDKSSGIFAVAP